MKLGPALASIFRRSPIVATAFILTTLLAVGFGSRFIYHVVYWSLHQDEPVRPWMTVGYVGRSWDIKPTVIDDLAKLPRPQSGKPMTLREIADQRGVPVGTIIAEVETAIRKVQLERQRLQNGHDGQGVDHVD